MPAYVVHRYERHAQRHGRGLGEVHAHQQRAYESGRVGDGHGVYVLPLQARHLQGALGEKRDDLDMAARGYLRHDPAVYGVQVCLGENLVRDQFSPVPDERNGSFVAGGFNCEYQHCGHFLMLRFIIIASSAGFS